MNNKTAQAEAFLGTRSAGLVSLLRYVGYLPSWPSPDAASTTTVAIFTSMAHKSTSPNDDITDYRDWNSPLSKAHGIFDLEEVVRRLR